jgi:hypothetical protein
MLDWRGISCRVRLPKFYYSIFFIRDAMVHLPTTMLPLSAVDAGNTKKTVLFPSLIENLS